MPRGRSAITQVTNRRLVLDNGVAYMNIDVAALESNVPDPWTAAISAPGAINLGAMRGGSSFDLKRTLRRIPINGKIGAIKRQIRRQESEPTITLNLLELTVNQLERILAGSTRTLTGGGKFSKFIGSVIDDAAYVQNVAIATTLTGSAGLPFVLVVLNPIVVEAPELRFTDNDEMVTAVSFLGTSLESAPLTESWAVYYPQLAVTADDAITLADSTLHTADEEMLFF
jgi:hypothetical protein